MNRIPWRWIAVVIVLTVLSIVSVLRSDEPFWWIMGVWAVLVIAAAIIWKPKA